MTSNEQREPEDQQSAPNSTKVGSFQWAGFCAWTGLIVGILGTGVVTLLSCGWFRNHHDVGNGAVLWFGMIFMVGVATFLVGLPCSAIAIRLGRRLGWLGLILSIAPVPSGFAILHIAMAVNGFHVTS